MRRRRAAAQPSDSRSRSEFYDLPRETEISYFFSGPQKRRRIRRSFENLASSDCCFGTLDANTEPMMIRWSDPRFPISDGKSRYSRDSDREHNFWRARLCRYVREWDGLWGRSPKDRSGWGGVKRRGCGGIYLYIYISADGCQCDGGLVLRPPRKNIRSGLRIDIHHI